MRRFTALLVLNFVAQAHAEVGEAALTLEGGVLFPLVESQSQTAFANASWLVGARFDYGVTRDLRVGARFLYAQFDGQHSVTTDVGGVPIRDTFAFDLAAYAPQVFASYDLLVGYAVRPQLLVAGGYTWMVYDDVDLPQDADDSPFAEGSFTTSAGLQFQARPLTHLTLTAGAEYVHHVDGLWRGSFRVPVTATYLFW